MKIFFFGFWSASKASKKQGLLRRRGFVWFRTTIFYTLIQPCYKTLVKMVYAVYGCLSRKIQSQHSLIFRKTFNPSDGSTQVQPLRRFNPRWFNHQTVQPLRQFNTFRRFNPQTVQSPSDCSTPQTVQRPFTWVPPLQPLFVRFNPCSNRFGPS